MMRNKEFKRAAIIDQVADQLLAHGLKESSLRKLGAAAGTSDRMLLHYFADKEELLEAALTRLTERLIQLLGGARLAPVPYSSLVPFLAEMMKDARVRPYLRLSLELAALSAGGSGAYAGISRQICDEFFRWIAQSLQVEHEEDRVPVAALAFAVTEGLMVLDALNCEAIADSALRGVSTCPDGTRRRLEPGYRAD